MSVYTLCTGPQIKTGSAGAHINNISIKIKYFQANVHKIEVKRCKTSTTPSCKRPPKGSEKKSEFDTKIIPQFELKVIFVNDSISTC